MKANLLDDGIVDTLVSAGATSAFTLPFRWGAALRKEARELLEPVYHRFTEGLATADLRAAEPLIHDLS